MRERSRDSSMHFIGIYLLEPEQLILMKAQEGGQLVFCPPLEKVLRTPIEIIVYLGFDHLKNLR